MLMVFAPWKVQGVSRNWPSAIHLARQIINSHPKKMTVSSASIPPASLALATT
jgi:hypothetical protein